MAVRNVNRLIGSLAVVLFGAQAAAAQPSGPLDRVTVVALEPTPHAAGCDDFTSVGPGIWRPKGAVRVRNTVTVERGAAFGDDKSYAGIKLAKWLDQSCKVAN